MNDCDNLLRDCRRYHKAHICTLGAVWLIGKAPKPSMLVAFDALQGERDRPAPTARASPFEPDFVSGTPHHLWRMPR
jgi:hypothetical protein